MGRNAKPIGVLTLDGKKHLVKKEIEQRKVFEKSMQSGIKTFEPSEQVSNNPEALNMFNKLKALYKDITYVDGLDENIINRYCLIYSETTILQTILNILTKSIKKANFVERLEISNRIINTIKAIQSSREMLLKLEDRLLLNPTARIKNIPKKIEETKEVSKFNKFGGGSMSG